MTKLLMTCGLMVALAACASNQPAASSASSSPGTPAQVAPAAGSVVAAASATTAAKPAAPKLVCEETDQMGSHFQQRVCMTPEQMEARRKAAQAAMLSSHSVAACGNNGCPGGASGPPR
jgi:hypothetical protein